MTREQRLLEALSPLTEAEKAAVLEAAELNGSLTTDAVIGAMAFKKYHAAPDEGPGDEKTEKTADWERIQEAAIKCYPGDGNLKHQKRAAFRNGVGWRDHNPKPVYGPGDGECDCGSERQGHVGEHLSGCPAARAHTPKGKSDLETYEFDKSEYIELPSFTPKGQGAEFPIKDFNKWVEADEKTWTYKIALDAAKRYFELGLASRPKAEGRELYVTEFKNEFDVWQPLHATNSKEKAYNDAGRTGRVLHVRVVGDV